MAYRHKEDINLLHNIEGPVGSFDIFYSWVFKIGKHILIGVEVLVVIAFIFKIFLDSTYASVVNKSNSLQSKLNSTSMVTKVNKITKYQQSINTITSLETFKEKTGTTLYDILHLIPSGIVVTNVSLDINKFLISGTASTYAQLQILSNNFTHDSSQFSNVLIPQLTNSSLQSINNINFSLSANLINKQ
jgi:hypothetical protein